jgi:hypothetical protein
VGYRGGAGDRQHDRGAAQQPGQGELGGGGVMFLGGGLEGPPGWASCPVAMGNQGMKAMLLASA